MKKINIELQVLLFKEILRQINIMGYMNNRLLEYTVFIKVMVNLDVNYKIHENAEQRKIKNFWSKDYQSAKVKFLDLIESLQDKNLNIQLESLDIEEQLIHLNDLSVDIAYIGDAH